MAQTQTRQPTDEELRLEENGWVLAEPPMPLPMNVVTGSAPAVRPRRCNICLDENHGHQPKDCTSDRALVRVYKALCHLVREKSNLEPAGTLLAYLNRKPLVTSLFSSALSLPRTPAGVAAALLDPDFISSIAAGVVRNPDIGLVPSAVFMALCGRPPVREQAGLRLAMAAAQSTVADRTPRDVLRRIMAAQEPGPKPIPNRKRNIQVAVVPPGECPVCLESHTIMIRTACNHSLCIECFGRTAKAKNNDVLQQTCSLCRQKIFPITAGEGVAFLFR